MTAAIVVLVLLLALFVCLAGIRKNSSRALTENQFFSRKQNEIDVRVLDLLLSREEDEYLRSSLAHTQFREIKRERIKVAWKYLEEIGRTTRHLIRVIESARSSSDPEVAKAAHELLQIAFRIKMNVPLVRGTLLIEWLCPSLRWPKELNVRRYRELVERSVFILQRLESRQGNVPQLGNSI